MGSSLRSSRHDPAGAVITYPFIVHVPNPASAEVNWAVTSKVALPLAVANAPVPPTNVALYLRLTKLGLAGSNTAVPKASNFRLAVPSAAVSVQGLVLTITIGWPAVVGRWTSPSP